MILEALLTTVSLEGRFNLAPMGPVVEEGDVELARFVLRPYTTSTTFRNLSETGEGVLHVTDDAMLMARAAIERLDEREVPHRAADRVRGIVLTGACRYHEFRVIEVEEVGDRARLLAETVVTGRFRDFFGFNRAKHAVLEAAILATRLDFLPWARIREEFERLQIPVEKTGGRAELAAFETLREHVWNVARSRGDEAVPWAR